MRETGTTAGQWQTSHIT